MNIDISQFHETFLEEASENLTDLEKGLLSFEETDTPDMDAIFRAAHSIKGGAATFGFEAIASFTHVVEHVLQDARDDKIKITSELTTALLESVDIIASLIDISKTGGDVSTVDQSACLNVLKSYIEGNQEETTPSQEEAVQEDNENTIISITFKPFSNLPATGSDPLNIFRELSSLGDLSITAHTESIPTLNDLKVDDLYLWWELELITTASEQDVQDAFLFVEDEAEITISIVGAIAAATPTEEVVIKEEVPTPQPEKENRRATDRRQQEDRRNTATPAATAKESAYIRVAVDKVDSLINLVGELVTTNAMVLQRSNGLDQELHQGLQTAINEMSSHTRSLQEGIMAIRMMPIDFAFSRFPRMVRDTAKKLHKKVNLETEGAQTELDKTVIECIADPLTHLVRNSVDHGIETPEERKAVGKSEEGTIHLNAYYRGGNVIIDVEDDGKGLDKDAILKKAIERGLASENDNLSDDEVFQFIFHSGFSTAKEVTDVSGRGVGMDVVNKNIKSLGGNIAISSQKGIGSCISISLPLTLAIVDGMAIKCGQETYIIPLLNIVESVRPTEDLIRTLQDDVEVIDIRGDYLPILRLAEALQVESGNAVKQLDKGIAVIVEAGKDKIALFVDELLGEQQVVIKSIEENYKDVEGLSGATILGDGRVAFILDLQSIIRASEREGRYVKPIQSEIPQSTTNQPEVHIH